MATSMARLLRIVPIALALSGTWAWADDISDAISQAGKAYQAGDLGSAKQALDMAAQLIAQNNAEGLVKVLPQPLAGWTAEDAEANAPGVMAMGGSTASRRYKKGEDVDVQISISADGAYLMQQAAIFSNPQMAGLLGKLVPIGSQKAIQTKEGNLTLVVANRFVITVDGSGSPEDKLAYAKAIDFGALAKVK